ncbi:hypothetical protein Pmani_025364 [Petrolisthes manimaculis]|uniref:Secreted protein n=1 Tax=Petrolisthes manimaculis TaxID=1843537 RepID=A0AAE1P5N5_9EUCA|nr:hypothetical protein Pmani_025364 [Petrolisthes manimaculis]
MHKLSAYNRSHLALLLLSLLKSCEEAGVSAIDSKDSLTSTYNTLDLLTVGCVMKLRRHITLEPHHWWTSLLQCPVDGIHKCYVSPGGMI